MMNRIGIRDEDKMGSREPGSRIAGRPGPGARWSGSGWFDGSGVAMAGMVKGYWEELRPSSAARLRLDATIRHDREPTARHPRRRPARPRLRRAPASRG
jgi:hypothetical protein